MAPLAKKATILRGKCDKAGLKMSFTYAIFEYDKAGLRILHS